MGVKTTTKDKGFSKLYKTLKDINNAQPSVTIGVHDNSGSYPHDDVTVAEVAFWNEYGTRISPERSFIRSVIDENRAKYITKTKELWNKVIKNEMAVDKAMNQLGFMIAIDIQNKIKTLMDPPNAASTTFRKTFGRSANTNNYLAKPLINSGLLLRSIGFQVFNVVKSEVIKNPGGN